MTLTTTRKHRSRGWLAAAAMALGLGAGTLGGASTAQAAEPLPDNLQKYANCPVDDPSVSTCIYIQTGSSQLKLGRWDFATDDPFTFQFGLGFDEAANPITVAPTNGTPVMTAPLLRVPGGLTGIPGAGIGPLAAYGKPELTSLPKVDIRALIQRRGVAFKLDMRAKVVNVFTDFFSLLGPGCYVGSTGSPISLNLTTGTTAPPPPNQPISGARGTTVVDGEPEGGLRFEGTKVVDNAFATPGATGCGPFGSLNWAVNANGKIPSAAGTNTAALDVTVYQVDANTVRAALGG